MDNVTITEGSTAFFNVSLLDEDGNPGNPTAAFLSVVCLTNQVEVSPEAPIDGLGSILELKIPSATNALIRRRNSVEVKRAIVRVVYGAGDEFQTSRDYMVRKVEL